MLTEAQLVQEFTTLLQRTYPQTRELLRYCYIKLVTAHWGQPPKRLNYMAIYCPDTFMAAITTNKPAFRHISSYMGLADPVCINATRLLRDPKSNLKESAPSFWLELHWLLCAQTS